jgi:hypothetical protein
MKILNNVVYYNAGQVATIVLNVLDDNDNNQSLIEPQITTIYDPNLKKLSSYSFPLPMVELEESIYIAKIQIPKSIKASGTYLCVVEWFKSPDKNQKCKAVYSIIVGIPIGNPSAAGA